MIDTGHTPDSSLIDRYPEDRGGRNSRIGCHLFKNPVYAFLTPFRYPRGMSKNFTETELDTLAEEFRSDSTSLPRFARSRGIPYMTMKNHLKKKGDVDVMNGGKACERSVILNEYRESMLSVPEFCERQGISEQYLEAWLEEDSRGRNRGYQSEWKRLIDEFFESDFLNVHDFARAKGFDGSNMKYWLEKIDPEKRWKRKGEGGVNNCL